MPEWAFVVLGLAAFAVVFPAFWCGVVWLVGAMGWRALATRYPADAPATGQPLGLTSGTIGGANYNGALKVSVEREGLHLAVMALFRVGHPPMLIPWSEITSVTQKNALWARWYTLRIGTPHVATVRLPGRIVDAIRATVADALADARSEAPPAG